MVSWFAKSKTKNAFIVKGYTQIAATITQAKSINRSSLRRPPRLE